tara:strand:- start:1884 stop:2396 length:513 start_codon:yes stop_codon:yes gene_type:complete
MNLRQQFFWKLLLIISSLAIILSLWRVYDKYDKFSKYEETITNKDTEQINKNIQIEAEFILEQQQIRMDIQPNYAFIQDLGIMDHVRAGLKTKSMNEWDSKDPVFKAFIDPICIIEYRDEKRTQYEAGDTINGTSMVIQSCNKDSVVVHIDSNKDDIQQRVFYMSKEKKE